MEKHVRDLDAAERLHGQLQNLLEKKRCAQKAGVPALLRLVAVAQRDTGQSGVVGRFLLGLYNGYAHPFDLTWLRRLDEELRLDCMTVLAMDCHPDKEVHQYVPDGDQIFRELAEFWGGDANAR